MARGGGLEPGGGAVVVALRRGFEYFLGGTDVQLPSRAAATGAPNQRF
jgi:hypothetical protein